MDIIKRHIEHLEFRLNYPLDNTNWRGLLKTDVVSPNHKDAKNILKGVKKVRQYVFVPTADIIRNRSVCVEAKLHAVFKTADGLYYDCRVINRDSTPTFVTPIDKAAYNSTQINITNPIFYGGNLTTDQKIATIEGIGTTDPKRTAKFLNRDYLDLLEGDADELEVDFDNNHCAASGGTNVRIDAHLKSYTLKELLNNLPMASACKCLLKCDTFDYKSYEFMYQIDNKTFLIKIIDDDASCAGHHVQYSFNEYSDDEQMAANQDLEGVRRIYTNIHMPIVNSVNYYYVTFFGV